MEEALVHNKHYEYDGVIITDLSTAFDTVNLLIYFNTVNEFLIAKLGRCVWFDTESSKVIKSFLTNRLIQQTTRTRLNRMPTFHCRTDCFKNSFLSFHSKRLVQIR